MTPRDYQIEAYEAVINSLKRGENTAVSIATGGGKSLILAMLLDKIRRGGGYALMLTHSAELVVQDVRTLRLHSGLAGVGVYSAGLNSYTIGDAITCGTVQSIYRNLDKLPHPPDVIFIDEAHLISPKDTDSKMYNTIFKRYPEARRVGLSATPYRLDKGLIYGGKETWFDSLAIEIDVLRLVEEGWLAPLVGVSTEIQLDLKGVHKVAGDFNAKEVEERATEEWLRAVLTKVRDLADKRQRILLFAPTVKTAALAAQVSNTLGIPADYVHAGDDERSDRLASWKAGDFRLMANVNILTTGFDLPILDCIVDISPTESLGRHIQKMGRGTRLAEGKKNCLYLDFAGNLKRLGGISAKMEFLEEKKGAFVKGSVTKKPGKRVLKTEGGLSNLDPMASSGAAFEVAVRNVSYIVIGSKTQEGRSMVMVQYSCVTTEGYSLTASEFLCTEYIGYAREKAEDWFHRRGIKNVPYLARDAQTECYGLPAPRHITIRKNNRYFNVVSERF